MSPVAVGLSLRQAWSEALLELEDRRALDVLEVMVDEVLCDSLWRRCVRRLGSRWPLVAHGVALGIGDARGLDPHYVRAVHGALRHLHVRWYGEHLAFLRGGEVELAHFAPIGDDAETLSTLGRNAEQVRDGCPCPLLLENPADVLGFLADAARAGERLGEAYARALEHTGAGALLDVTNLLYGARNDGYDPTDFLDQLPWERIVQVHLAGGRRIGPLWVDSHDRPIEEESLMLLGTVAARAPHLRAVTLEWDENLPAFDVVLEELGRVKRVLRGVGRR